MKIIINNDIMIFFSSSGGGPEKNFRQNPGAASGIKIVKSVEKIKDELTRVIKERLAKG